MYFINVRRSRFRFLSHWRTRCTSYFLTQLVTRNVNHLTLSWWSASITYRGHCVTDRQVRTCTWCLADIAACDHNHTHNHFPFCQACKWLGGIRPFVCLCLWSAIILHQELVYCFVKYFMENWLSMWSGEVPHKELHSPSQWFGEVLHEELEQSVVWWSAAWRTEAVCSLMKCCLKNWYSLEQSVVWWSAAWRTDIVCVLMKWCMKNWHSLWFDEVLHEELT